MGFRDRLKEKRITAGLSQAELAEKAGVTARTIQNYESGCRKPSSMEALQRMADAMATTTGYLLGSTDGCAIEANEKGGIPAAQDIRVLVGQVAGLFAGGKLDDDALDGAMRALNDAYWIAKEKNKKARRRKK